MKIYLEIFQKDTILELVIYIIKLLIDFYSVWLWKKLWSHLYFYKKIFQQGQTSFLDWTYGLDFMSVETDL